MEFEGNREQTDIFALRQHFFDWIVGTKMAATVLFPMDGGLPEGGGRVRGWRKQ